MNLEQLQHAVFNLIRQPLTADERMRPLTPSGEPTDKIARTLVKPNDRLTSAERLEIYNRAYWFRLLSALAEDFPGLCAVIGKKKFDAVLQAYLSDCPSESFTLRNLGSRLEDWLRRHPQFVRSNFPLALDMVRLEWAEIEAFDAPEFPRLSLCDLQAFGDGTVFTLQPFLRLLQLNYPVDDLLLKIRDQLEPANDVTSNSVQDRKIQAKALRQHMPGRERIFLAVHRQEGTVFFKRLEPEAFRLLDRLQQGDSLSQALEASFGRTVQSPEYISRELQAWFSNWASLGWFCREEQR